MYLDTWKTRNDVTIASTPGRPHKTLVFAMHLYTEIVTMCQTSWREHMRPRAQHRSNGIFEEPQRLKLIEAQFRPTTVVKDFQAQAFTATRRHYNNTIEIP